MIYDSSVLCPASTVDVMGGGEVAFDGTNFSFQGSGSTSLGKGRVTYRWTVKGQVSGGAATGTLHVTGVRRGNGRPRKCGRKPDRAFAVRLAPSPTGAPAQPQPRAFYAGTSNFEIFDRIQSPVTLRATTDGRKISSQWTVSGKCGRGPRDHFVNFTPAMRVRPDGTFSRSERFSVRYADVLIRYRPQFTGAIKSDGATGTLRLRTTIYNRRGTKLLTRCDSGGRVWNAVPA